MWSFLTIPFILWEVLARPVVGKKEEQYSEMVLRLQLRSGLRSSEGEDLCRDTLEVT